MVSDQRNPKLVNTRCPRCNKRLDATTCIGEEGEPSPGDFAVCIYCAVIAVYKDDLTMRLPDITDVNRAIANPERWAKLAAVQKAARERIQQDAGKN